MKIAVCFIQVGLVFSFQAGQARAADVLIDLSFSPNAGDVASHGDVSNVSAWSNGSELNSGPFGPVGVIPTTDFSNGYAGLTVSLGSFGHMWGFEGGFDVASVEPWEVTEISFDYDVLGHNGEALLSLSVGGWSGTAPLPSTGVNGSGPNFATTVSGTQVTGTVTFDFLGDTLTVTSSAHPSYTTAFNDSFDLTTGTHAIDILTTNAAAGSSGVFDATVDALGGAPDAFYRVDNFRVLGQQAPPVPEPSSALLAIASGGLFLLRRRR